MHTFTHALLAATPLLGRTAALQANRPMLPICHTRIHPSWMAGCYTTARAHDSAPGNRPNLPILPCARIHPSWMAAAAAPGGAQASWGAAACSSGCCSRQPRVLQRCALCVHSSIMDVCCRLPWRAGVLQPAAAPPVWRVCHPGVHKHSLPDEGADASAFPAGCRIHQVVLLHHGTGTRGLLRHGTGVRCCLLLFRSVPRFW